MYFLSFSFEIGAYAVKEAAAVLDITAIESVFKPSKLTACPPFLPVEESVEAPGWCLR